MNEIKDPLNEQLKDAFKLLIQGILDFIHELAPLLK